EGRFARFEATATSVARCFRPSPVAEDRRDLLGHSTDKMATRHYNRATGITACTQYQDALEQFLEDHAPVERIRLPKRSNSPDDPDN
ncbi:MAG: hypothetical protein VX228_06760, partial [Pseudomonadota bacterium]|nr:hypothetical protein [Pseudomonadota bacterium]